MTEVYSVYQPRVSAVFERFNLKVEELRLFVVYTYYDKDGQPLYVGCSKSFCDAHYFNTTRLSFFNDIQYVGFVFFSCESELKEFKPIYIKARKPKYNKHQYKAVPEDKELTKFYGVEADELVVEVKEMEDYWWGNIE